MRAAIDVGSNSVRMMLQQTDGSRSPVPQYYRQVTRLAGGYHPVSGLAPQSMARTLPVLEQFAALLKQKSVEKVRAVGTAVLRNASDSLEFIETIRQRTGLRVEIIDGQTEARLSCLGIVSVLDPVPQRALLFDIGGGSTEVILFDNQKVCIQRSFPLGVVRLFEDYPDPAQGYAAIQQELSSFLENPVWKKWQQDAAPIELVGTAGTITTLAALKLQMVEYDASRVNNLSLERSWLEYMHHFLLGLPLNERALLPGMEEGRADVIVPGLQIVNILLDIVGCDSLRVADAGLLEGLLLEPSGFSFILDPPAKK